MDTGRNLRLGKVALWNSVLLTLSLLTLAAFVSIRHPRTDEISFFWFHVNKLFFASTLLSILLAFNAVRFLVVLRQRTVGLILALVTGVSVFFLVEWFLKLQTAH
jgi:hypothetical protein